LEKNRGEKREPEGVGNEVIASGFLTYCHEGLKWDYPQLEEARSGDSTSSARDSCATACGIAGTSFLKLRIVPLKAFMAI
jgi:hypothetical protein